MAYRSLSVNRILSLTGLSQPGGIWRLLAIVFALLNLKSLPFGWHVRAHQTPQSAGASVFSD